MLAGWPLKEQLVPALIQPVDVAAAPTIDYLGRWHRSIWAVLRLVCACVASGVSASMSVLGCQVWKNVLDLAT